ncbi:MAG: PepSY domain-containing protein [Armatimonadetes bacterium]|nr:PepSY domain-containing protein [Armatimonadota bacterium]
MYHSVRTFHRWVGITAALFLVVIAGSGFLLATKDSFSWVKPPTREGSPIEDLGELVSIQLATEAAFAAGLADLQSTSDIDRVDYRPAQNVYKIRSRRGYHEVQVCGKTGEVLQVAQRNDQLVEDIHDMSYFAEILHTYWLPAVSVLLFSMAITGVTIFTVPIVRRIRFRRKYKG